MSTQLTVGARIYRPARLVSAGDGYGVDSLKIGSPDRLLKIARP